jgi:hypothetical protein
MAANSWLLEPAASLYEEFTLKLFERHDQCLKKFDNYAEK